MCCKLYMINNMIALLSGIQFKTNYSLLMTVSFICYNGERLRYFLRQPLKEHIAFEKPKLLLSVYKYKFYSLS